MGNREPDGWCAWHPDKGWAFHTKTASRDKTFNALVNMVQDNKLDSKSSKEARIRRDHGYEIKPVKLIDPAEYARLVAADQFTKHLLEFLVLPLVNGEETTKHSDKYDRAIMQFMSRYDAITSSKEPTP